ncbi:MAG: proline--tRNA ligase, partial [Candidatus Omnitrophota bacterium]|nr:proline--tRNA ligase [Candidatus Omnitrophota bacterium]
SHKLLLRAGLARMLMAGAYSYLPLGLKVLTNIEGIIRREMNAAGASEVLLPALQPLELWQKTGRDKDIGEVMIRFKDRRGRNIALGPTHEEVITHLVSCNLSSYRQLPLVLYQIQTKFRDEIRPRFGLIRACEFIMKDAYSFDRDEAGLDANYKSMYEAYNKIFKRCGLQVLITEADSGVMGGKISHEFMVPAPDGEDIVVFCPECASARTYKEGDKTACLKCGKEAQRTNTIEIGHIFKLGTKYSSLLGANFLDADGKQKPAIMGCYGIGVSRLISAAIEQSNDKDGIIWPMELAPYKVILLPLDTGDNATMDSTRSAAEVLEKSGIEPLIDDRDERPGVKFKDADLLGIPLQVVIGRDAVKRGQLELKIRRDQEKSVENKDEILRKAIALING